jgi:flagellar basal-body rod protein FlgC
MFVFLQILNKRCFMTSSVGPNLSALSAFGSKMQTIANNVANVNTEGYQKKRSDIVEGPHGHPKATQRQVPQPGSANPEAGRHPLEAEHLSNVNLAEEIPQTIITQRGYEANLKVVKTHDEMMGSVLDILG